MSGLFSFDTENPIPDTGSVPVAAAAERAIKASKKGRGNVSGTEGTSGADTGGTRDVLTKASPEFRQYFAAEIEKLYDPKVWGSLLALPCHVGLTVTGRKHWDISKDEKDELGASGSLVARFLAIENPKTLAILMLSSALFAVYVPRVMEELKYHRKDAKTEPGKTP